MTHSSELKNTRLLYVRSYVHHNFEVKTVDGKTLGVMIFIPMSNFGEIDAMVLKVRLYNAVMFEFSDSQTNAIDFMEHLEKLYGYRSQNLPDGWQYYAREFNRIINLNEISKIFGSDISDPSWGDVTEMLCETPCLVRFSDLVWDSKELCSEVVDGPLRSLLPIIAELTSELDRVAHEWLANNKELRHDDRT